MLRNSRRQPPSHPKPLILLSPNPFSVNGHTCSESCLTVGAFVPLQDAILKAFYPALVEGDLSDVECKQFSLPTRFDGLGINNPTETASSSYHTSTQGTKVVVEAIKGCGEFSSACHLDAISKARHESRKALDEIAKQKLDAILATLSPGRQCAIMRVVEGKTSSWLTTQPLQSCHFDLAPVQFRDGLALRYLRHPSNLPANCDGCGANFTLQHALDCKKGDLLYYATMRFVTALVILPVRCGPKL